MEKEEKVVVVLLFMTLSSLLTAYLCFGPELAGAGQTGGKVTQYTQGPSAGEKVSIEAEVMSKSFTHKGEHLILQVDCNSEILNVFVPKTAGAEALNMSIQKGDLIRAFTVITASDFDRVAGIANINKLHAFYNATVINI